VPGEDQGGELIAATFVLDTDLLNAARSVGGEIDTEHDRQTQPVERMPFYTVVGNNSKDANYRATLEGKSIVASRAGEFRLKNAEGEPEYFDELTNLIIIDARTANTLFEDQKVACRGLSTKGFYSAVVTDGKMGKGFSCEACPYNRFFWQNKGGREGQVTSPEGKVIGKDDLCNSSLQLWCWSQDTDTGCIVQFSAGALRHYREFVRNVETQGVKMHSLLWRLTTQQVENGANTAPSYVPNLEPIRVLTTEEYEAADARRAVLISKAMDLAQSGSAAALPPPTSQKALPTVSAFSAPPKGLAEDDDIIKADPFIGID
jgi:hypothetical protein